jgi:hypothetical protein
MCVAVLQYAAVRALHYAGHCCAQETSRSEALTLAQLLAIRVRCSCVVFSHALAYADKDYQRASSRTK